MTEQEKVIKALQKEIDEATYPVRPLRFMFPLELAEQILARLKAQEPRLMTLEKTQTALHNDDVVWVEIKDKIICGGIRMDGTDYFTMQNGDVLDVTDFDSGEGAEMYGREVRCWTSRPSDEQRRNTPWT